MNTSFWDKKKVFITGHTGFKGSWLSLWLQYLGAEVTGFALKPPTTPSLFEQAKVAEGMLSLEGDICDFDQLRDAIHDAGPDLVLHLAAQPLVRRSYMDPIETYATNVMGTVHLLEAVRSCSSVRTVVNVTTDKCYENKEWVWPYRENEPMGGYDPYSSSKACSELVTAAFRSSYFNPRGFGDHRLAVATARAGNVIGGGDWASDRLIPDVLRAFSRGEPVRIRNPRAIRPWQHVLEPLRGYLTLAERLWRDGPAFAEAWNFGPDLEDARPVSWIVAKMAERWGNDATWEIDDAEHPHEAQYLKLDISKARAGLNWRPAIRLDQALDLTIEWHARLADGCEMRQMTIDQITRYHEMFE